MKSSDPIGIFDSGVGGLSVWKEIVKLLPSENIIYYADSNNCPYGSRSQEEVISLSDNIVRFLLQKKCKLIVVACNTATGAAIDYLRKKHEITFVGMEPAVKPAALRTKTGNIGILATKGTFQGRLFKETSKKWAGNRNMLIQIGEGLVECVEKGKSNSPEAKKLLKKYILPMLENNVDQLVLGCTHYPFLLPAIKKIVKNKAEIIDPAPAIAKRVADLLEQEKSLTAQKKNGKYSFFINGDKTTMEKMLYEILNDPVEIFTI